MRSFLGLLGYYRKFIQDCRVIAAPLTALLKEVFLWSEDIGRTFDALKTALTTAPVLQLSDFTILFILDCDASGSGFGAMLHQGSGQSLTSVRQSLLDTPPWQLTSGSLSGWSRQYNIGGHTSGGALLLSRPTTTTSSSSSTSGLRPSPNIIESASCWVSTLLWSTSRDTRMSWPTPSLDAACQVPTCVLSQGQLSTSCKTSGMLRTPTQPWWAFWGQLESSEHPGPLSMASSHLSTRHMCHRHPR